MNGAAHFTGVAPFFLLKTEVSNYSYKGLCVGGLTRGKSLQRRGLLYESTRHIYGVAVLHKVRPYSGGDCA